MGGAREHYNTGVSTTKAQKRDKKARARRSPTSNLGGTPGSI